MSEHTHSPTLVERLGDLWPALSVQEIRDLRKEAAAEIDRLTAALSLAERERDVANGMVDRLTAELAKAIEGLDLVEAERDSLREQLLAMRSRVHLGRGKYAVIDPEDYDLVSGYRWCAAQNHGALYACASVEKGAAALKMHRLVLGIEDASLVVDHINGDTLDNRKANLRACTARENSINCKVRYDSKSGYKGVRQIPSGRWEANITVKGKRKYLGTFSTAEEAAEAYGNAARHNFGEFARSDTRDAARKRTEEVTEE